MGVRDTKDLKGFLEPFDERIADLAPWLRKFVWKLYPERNELIYDNYKRACDRLVVDAEDERHILLHSPV